MRFFGLADEIAEAPREDEVEEEQYPIWPDNLTTLNVFLKLRNSWHIVVAPDGELIRTGLRSESIEFFLRYTNGLPRRRWEEVIADLQAMETAAMQPLNKAREERRKRRAEDREAARNSR